MDIFIGGIPFKWSEKKLIELFEVYGDVVSAKIVINKMTRQSKGFGFIAMANDIAAHQAIEALNGKNFEGRNIIVSISNPNKQEPKALKNKRVEHPSESTENKKAWKPFRGNNWRE
jgi:RNA recognition motif-containing protein